MTESTAILSILTTCNTKQSIEMTFSNLQGRSCAKPSSKIRKKIEVQVAEVPTYTVPNGIIQLGNRELELMFQLLLTVFPRVQDHLIAKRQDLGGKSRIQDPKNKISRKKNREHRQKH